jgi:hypothetical protein
MKTICREVILRLGDQTDSWTLPDLSAKRKAQTEGEYVNSDFTAQMFRFDHSESNKHCGCLAALQP